MNEWEKLENEIQEQFPGLRKTSGSGAVWHDGDLDGRGISFEAKDHKRVSFDPWWNQTRTQALLRGLQPCLVMRRPPAKLSHGRAVTDEVVACVPLAFLAELLQTIDTALSDIGQLETEISKAYAHGHSAGWDAGFDRAQEQLSDGSR